MTADREKLIMPNRARALLRPRQPVGNALVLLSSVATKRMPTTPTIEPTAIFSQMPTSFMPTNTTPAPIT